MVERKSLKDISWLVDEPVYREDPAYSYSTISKFNREGFDKLDTLFDRVESPSLTFGSMVDTLLTDGEEAFNQRFFVAQFPTIPDKMVSIIRAVVERWPECQKLSDMGDADLINLTEEFDFQKNWQPATRAKVIKEKAATYFDMLLLSKDKELVTSEMAQDARDCVETLRNHPATKWYFQQDNPFENTERLYQLKFKGEYNGIPLRCMMDLVIVDHRNKVIIPIDLKTSFKPEYKFYYSFIEWGYYIQANLYAELLKQNLAKDPYFCDFKVLDYRFIVICNKTRNPKVWEWTYTFSTTDLDLNGVKLKNWRGIVTELDHYLKYKPSSPNGIKENEINDLATWIQQIEK